MNSRSLLEPLKRERGVGAWFAVLPDLDSGSLLLVVLDFSQPQGGGHS